MPLLYRVMFEGSSDGEFWYEINLEALNPEIVQIPLMECEVGRYIIFKPAAGMLAS